jgi:undecaprenyl-diphosphatase
MDLLHAIFLGILQGATEFLPISSSGHLALAEHYLGFKEAGLAFDVALHLGTLLSILIYFRNDFILMGKALLFIDIGTDDAKSLRKLAFFIVLATIPGVAAGLLFGEASESFLRQPVYVATALGVIGLFLLWGEKSGLHNRDFQSITLKDAVLIGLSQALAIVPGVSRSGITMTTGLFRGLNRQAVARFSFLLSAPIIFGAGVYKIPAMLKDGLADGNFPFYTAGFISAALSGYFFIAFLLKFVRTRTFEIFAYYRFAIAAIVFAILLFS